MHKLEIHTTEKGLSRLNFINQDHLIKAGYHKVDAKILSDEHGANSSDIKIEAFVSQLPEDLIALLESDSLISQFSITECAQTYLFEELIPDETEEEYEPNVSESVSEPSLQYALPATSEETDVEVKELPTGKLKLTLQSTNTTYFLCKVIGVLAQHDIPLEKAQTFPQSDHITGTFVIPRINAEQLSHLKREISQELTVIAMGNCGYKKFSRAAISPEELQISLDTSGSMACLKIKCNQNDILSRFTILEAISLFDQEVTISRLGGLGKKIEDTYYIKPVKDIFISEDLLNQITKHITGNK